MPESSRKTERVLLVVDEEISGDALSRSVAEHLGDTTTEVFVVAPALTDSALKQQMGDVDDAMGPAQERLERSLEALRSAGYQARGEVGDADPLLAMGDEVMKFAPERIVVVEHREAEEAPAEHGLVERSERDFSQPVTHLVVDTSGDEPRVVSVEQTEPGAGRDKGPQPSSNFPPLSKRDVLGVVVAVVGTITLGVLAGACAASDASPDLEEGRLDGVCPALILIAIVGALVNLAHVVGLFLFQSVRYEGIWERFFARMSLYGTPIAVVVSLVLYLQR